VEGGLASAIDAPQVLKTSNSFDGLKKAKSEAD